MEKGQHNCPFYGRHILGTLLDAPGRTVRVLYLAETNGNECGWILSRLSMCEEEAAARPPDWRTCHVLARTTLRFGGQ